jgi:hypothetical protein
MEVSQQPSVDQPPDKRGVWFDKLEAAGVTETTADELSRMWQVLPLRLSINVGIFVGLYGPLLWGLFYGFRQAELFMSQRALAMAVSGDGVLFRTGVGPSVLLVIFAFVVTYAWLLWWIVSQLRGPLQGIVALSLLDNYEHRRLKTKKFRRVVSDQRLGESSADFLLRLSSVFSASYRNWAIPLLLGFACFVVLDFRTFTYARADEIVDQPWVPWKGGGTYDLADAEYVEVGCNYTKDGGWAEYNVHFLDGAQFNIARFKPVDGSWIEAMQVVDQTLMEAGVPFRRSTFRDRDPMHPKCLEVQDRKLSPGEPGALRALLREGNVIGDDI